MKTILTTLSVTLAAGLIAGPALAQGSGVDNPWLRHPGMPPSRGKPGINDQLTVPPAVFFQQSVQSPVEQKQQKHKDPGGYVHLIPHVILRPSWPEVAATPEAKVPPTTFALAPASEYHFTPPRFNPTIGAEGSSILRAFAEDGRGILAGIGAAIAAACGCVFRKNKDA